MCVPSVCWYLVALTGVLREDGIAIDMENVTGLILCMEEQWIWFMCVLSVEETTI